MTTNQVLRNTINRDSLAESDIRPGLRFITFVSKQTGSRRSGAFTSHPYACYSNGYDGDLVADVLWDGGNGTERIVLLSTLAVVHDRYSGEFLPDVITIPDDTDA